MTAAIAVFMSRGRVTDPLPGFPKVVLWAWERPTNLSYISPASTGVAYLAETITFAHTGMQVRPRFQPLYVPRGTPIITVIRIESHGQIKPPSGQVAAEILRAVSLGRAKAVQIDYDARVSERSYYHELMVGLHNYLPHTIALEMTALVSWCESDDWIRDMPVVDAVPMFFRMGVDPHSTREHLPEPLCSAAIGLSTDEFSVTIPQGKRVFVFTSQPWTETAYRMIINESKHWS